MKKILFIALTVGALIFSCKTKEKKEKATT
jgi:hypothetical protein